MNKDVIYIEPEDDITDIIDRVRHAKNKLVALVPPKKIGVLRSAVNTKLIAKSARQADKVVVIVTQDASLIKLAAMAKLPVAKDLQSRPKLPSEIINSVKHGEEQVINEKDFDNEEPEEKPATPSKKSSSKPESKKSEKAKDTDQEFSSDDLEQEEEKKSKKKKDDKEIPSIEKYRKFIIAGIAGGVLLIIFLVWAIAFAPAAKISVAIRTVASNFSETVSFVEDRNKEDGDKGIFLLEKESAEKTKTVKFKATGQKDVGEKASGSLNVIATYTSANMDDTISVPAGTTFSYGEYGYTTTKAVSFVLEDGDCSIAQIKNGTCTISAKVNVEAVAAGPNYNISSTGNGFSSSIGGISATNSSAISGGTSRMATVVEQSDIDKAKSELENSADDELMNSIKTKFGEEFYVFESSIEKSVDNFKSSVEAGKEASEEVSLSATLRYTVYGANKNTMKHYIETKVSSNVAADQKVYEIDNMFVEKFQKNDGKITARLKAAAQTGPKVTEQDIVEKSLGRKIGEVTSLIKSINGVSSVKIDPSFFWVNSVPKDINKVNIELKVEE